MMKLSQTMILKVWREENMPKEWNLATISPIHKTGDRDDCGSYRGISLLATSHKVLSKFILKRLAPFIDEWTDDYQVGFRRGKSTNNQIFTIRQTLTKCWEYDIDVYCMFIDFSKAYDSYRKEIWKIMKRAYAPDKLIRLVKMGIKNSEYEVKIEDKKSNKFRITTAVRHHISCYF